MFEKGPSEIRTARLASVAESAALAMAVSRARVRWHAVALDTERAAR